MTVSSTNDRNDYIGTGAVDTYSYTFRIFSATDLRVTIRDTDGVESTLAYPDDYSVAGVGDAGGGSITLAAGDLTDDYSLSIRRVLPLLQSTDIRNQGAFFPEIHEDQFDRSIMIDQQQQDEIDRSLKAPETDPGELSLPGASDRANKFLAFDADGAPIAADTVGAGVPVTAFALTLLDDTTAAEARATLGAQSSSITASGTGAVARDVYDKLEDVISVADYGSLQQAINQAVSTGKKLVGVGGSTHVITESITVSGRLDADFRGDIIDASGMAAGASLNEARAFVVGGSIGASITVTANVVVGATTLTISNTATLSAGDFLLLSSDQLMVDGYGNTGTKRGEILRVLSVDSGTQVTIDGCASFQYLAASNAKVQKITMVSGVRLQNLGIVCGGVASGHTGLALDYCYDFEVKNVSVDGGEDTGMQTNYCMKGRFVGGTIENSTSPTAIPGGNTGYGIVLYDASRDILIDSVTFRNCRRAVTGGNQYASIYCTTQNCFVDGGFNGLGNHEPCWWWTIQDNTIVGVEEVGLQIRGQYTRVYRNKVVSPGIYGIRVRSFYDNPSGVNGTELVSNEVINAGAYGIYLDGDAANGRINGITIIGGYVRGSGSGNLYGRYCSDVIVSKIDLVGQTTAGATDGNGVFFNGSTTSGDRCERIKLSEVYVPAPLRNGLQFRYCDDVVISNSIVTDAVTYAINCLSCERVTVNGGDYEANGGNFSYGAYFQNTNYVIVSGATVVGLSSRTSSHGIVCQSTSSEACTDHVITGCNIINFVKAVLVTGTGANYSVVAGNNGRSCSSGTKFDVSSASQVLANNLS